MTSSSTEGIRRQRFDSLVAVYYPDMFRYAAWLCRDKAIAEDVVQEALLRAWKSLDALRDEAAAKHWLLTIVRRENARFFERKRLETVDIDDLTPAQEALLGVDTLIVTNAAGGLNMVYRAGDVMGLSERHLELAHQPVGEVGRGVAGRTTAPCHQ